MADETHVFFFQVLRYCGEFPVIADSERVKGILCLLCETKTEQIKLGT